MDHSSVDALKAAVDALADREMEPFVELISDEMVWRGQSPRWLWWRDAPS